MSLDECTVGFAVKDTIGTDIKNEILKCVEDVNFL